MKYFKRTFFNLFKPLINSFLAKRWNNNWKKTRVYWELRDARPVDIRTSLNCVSKKTCEKLKQLAKEITKNCKNDDEKALAIFEYTVKNVKYVPDINNYFKRDFWASPDETYWRKKGDCEDMAIFQMKLMQLVGIPAFRRKIVVGDTIYGYHAYTIYLRELENSWFTLDGAMMPEFSFNAWYSDIPHRLGDIYTTIDFTFNEEYCWGQHNLILSNKWFGGN